MDDLKLFDNLRNLDDVFNERFFVQNRDDEEQLLAEGIRIILFLTFDQPEDILIGNFGSGIIERMPRRLPTTTKIQSFGISVYSFEIRPNDVDLDLAAGFHCDDAGGTKITKKILNLEVKQISDGILTTTVLTVPSHGCLYDMMPEVPKILSVGSRLQQNKNSPIIPLMYIADASKIQSQLDNPVFFDSFTFKSGSLEAYESHCLVQMVQLPRPQLPNNMATMTLWIKERSSALILFPLAGYKPSQVAGITFSANAFSSMIPFQGSFTQVYVFNQTSVVLGSALKPTTTLEYIEYPWIMKFEQTLKCDDQKELGSLTYTAASNGLDTFKNSVYRLAPQIPVGSIYLKCYGVNDAPYVSSPYREIEAEKSIAMRIELEDVDSPIMFLALAKMPQKINVYQTDAIASESLGLVSLIAHSHLHVGWVDSLMSINEQKCYQNCRNHSLVGPLRFSEYGDEFSGAVEGILANTDVLEVTVAFEIAFYAKTFDIYAEIPEGISLLISTLKIVDGLEYFQIIWQGVPKPVAQVNSSFSIYGKQETLKKRLWTIDVCPSWALTSMFKFEFKKPVGVQFVSISAIYAYAYDRPVSGAH
jgi:hypothetical protein